MANEPPVGIPRVYGYQPAWHGDFEVCSSSPACPHRLALSVRWTWAGAIASMNGLRPAADFLQCDLAEFRDLCRRRTVNVCSRRGESFVQTQVSILVQGLQSFPML